METYPLSPFLIPFTTSFTPLFTCRAFDADNICLLGEQGHEYASHAPFFIGLCSFFSSFFCASGFAIGDRSSTGVRISSLDLSFFDFLGDLGSESSEFHERSGTAGYTPTRPLALPSQHLQPRFFPPLSYPFFPILPLLFLVNSATRLGM